MELIENMSATPIHILEVATEIIENIATHLDNSTLIAFTSTSPVVRKRTYHVFGRRLFRTVHIAMNPIGLRALQNIAYNLDLAKHVRILHFSRAMTMTDPVHDCEVIQENYIHTLPWSTSRKAPEVLRQDRIRANASHIAQALPVFRRLELISSEQIVGKSISGFIGQNGFERFKCPTGHCDSTVEYHGQDEGVLQSIRMAMEHVHNRSQLPGSIKIGFGQSYTFNLTTPAPLNPQAAITREQQRARVGKTVREAFGDRPWHLKLDFHVASSQNAYATPWKEWQKSHIDSLDVTYSDNPTRPFGNESGIQLLPLMKLRELSLRQLWTRAATLEELFQTSLDLDRITKVSLIRCSVLNRHIFFDSGSWQRIINTLLRMPNLSDLHLDHLECSADPLASRSLLGDFDEDLALTAVWGTRREVEAGLGHLASSYAIYRVRTSTKQDSVLLSERIPSKYYLNLRWANLKAALQVCPWADERIRRAIRHRFRRLYDGAGFVGCEPTVWQKTRKRSLLQLFEW
jgi:hypothetical protein